MELGTELKRIRVIEAKKTQLTLAKESNVTPHHLRMIESGKSQPSLPVLEKILQNLGYRIDLVKV